MGIIWEYCIILKNNFQKYCWEQQQQQQQQPTATTTKQ